MSKIALTLSIPHEGPHIPQFSISCNNATYLSFKGTDISSARFGNGNLTPKKGLKRLEFGVTGSTAATRFSVMVNTSAVLPPLAWSSLGPAPAASAARGGSLPKGEDVRAGQKKMLRERGEGGGRRLRIEDGGREWKERGDRTFDEKRGRSRADRGERVRRSERRQGRGVEVLEDRYLTEEEEESPRGASHHNEERRERVRRKDRKKSHNGDAQEELWEEEDKQRVRMRERERLEEEEEGRGRREDVDRRKKVSGKKISSKYSRSDTSSQLDSGYAEEVKRLPQARHERREQPQYRRSQRRQEDLRPVDYTYDGYGGHGGHDADVGVFAD